MLNDGKKTILSAMRIVFGNNSIRLPRDINVEIADEHRCRITLLSEKICNCNMQEDCNAFEGWAAAIYLSLGKDQTVILDVDNPFAAYKYKCNGHLCRFLYRAMKYDEQYDWFELSDYLKSEVGKFHAYLSDKTLTFKNNIPFGSAHENNNPECRVEARLAQSGELKRQLTGQFVVGDGSVYRQLPVGLFENEVAECNMVFTGSKSAVDLWNISSNEFRVYELKVSNKMVGIVTEIFFYSNYFRDLLIPGGLFMLNTEKNGDRGYQIIVNSQIEKIIGIMLADKYHPLVTKDVAVLLSNNNNQAIEYAITTYRNDETENTQE